MSVDTSATAASRASFTASIDAGSESASETWMGEAAGSAGAHGCASLDAPKVAVLASASDCCSHCAMALRSIKIYTADNLLLV